MVNRRRAEVMAPIVFGLSDGMMSLLGVILYLLGHQSLIVPAAIMGGVSSGVSMAAGSWLSDSDDGLGASLLMGAATGVGSVLPALPYLVARGAVALVAAAIICLLIAVLVSWLRQDRGTRTALLETVGVLSAVVAVVLLCGLAVPGGAA